MKEYYRIIFICSLVFFVIQILLNLKTPPLLGIIQSLCATIAFAGLAYLFIWLKTEAKKKNG